MLRGLSENVSSCAQPTRVRVPVRLCGEMNTLRLFQGDLLKNPFATVIPFCLELREFPEDPRDTIGGCHNS